MERGLQTKQVFRVVDENLKLSIWSHQTTNKALPRPTEPDSGLHGEEES